MSVRCFCNIHVVLICLSLFMFNSMFASNSSISGVVDPNAHPLLQKINRAIIKAKLDTKFRRNGDQQAESIKSGYSSGDSSSSTGNATAPATQGESLSALLRRAARIKRRREKLKEASDYQKDASDPGGVQKEREHMNVSVKKYEDPTNNHAKKSSFIAKKPWNVYGRRMQVYVGCGYFARLIRGLKCPVKSKYTIFRPLQTDKGVNDDGAGGIMLPHKIQPVLPVKNTFKNSARYECGFILYGNTAASLNFNASGDMRKYKFVLAKVPHEINYIDVPFEELKEKKDAVDGDIPKTYIADAEVFDLLSPGLNVLTQGYDVEFSIGASTAIVDRWWTELAFGGSLTYFRGAKSFHAIGFFVSLRLDYEIIKNLRFGVMYQGRVARRALKGFESLKGNFHTVAASVRLLLP